MERNDYSIETKTARTGLPRFRPRNARRPNNAFRMREKLANYLLFPLYDSVHELPGSLPVRAEMAGQSLLYLDRLSAGRSNDRALNLELAEGYLRLGTILQAPSEQGVADVPTRGSLGGTEPLTVNPEVYIPVAQVSDDLLRLIHVWFSPSIVVRSSAPLRDTIEGMQSAIATVDPLIPFSTFRSIEQIRSETLAEQQFQTALMAIMAGLALLLAAIGIYGLIAHSVVERTREMGIRLALGATTRDAVAAVAAPGVALAAGGATMGILCALEVTKVLRHMIWGVTATDAATFIGTALLLLLVAIAASLIPALRIVRLSPADTLRSE